MLLTHVACVALLAGMATAAHPLAAPGVTSLTDASVEYTVPRRHYVVLQRGGVRAVIVDNAALDVPDLPEHRQGYNGVASLSHERRRDNLLVPFYAGLNFEHIHDGTRAVDKERFEPRRFPMELRVIDEFTVEVHQPPTPNWRLASCGRYHLLPDGVIEYTFECVPKAYLFRNGFIGLFWASYIHEPKDPAINFKGRRAGAPSDDPRWIHAATPRHGVDSTHPPAESLPDLQFDAGFPLTLVKNRSSYVYTEPWYYGVSHDMAYVLLFRSRDRIWFAQSPTGGGGNNPAWDFQWFVPDYKVDEAYGFVMRAAYMPFEGREQIERATRAHRQALNGE